MSLAKIFALAVALAQLCVPAAGLACTSFMLRQGEQVVVGKSYDWNSGDGVLLINKRGVAKRALLLPGTPGEPARWTSKYGSVTFNQYGQGMPLGGINEQGLVVEIMWLTKTRHAPRKGRATVNELQWIQYLLDTAGTLKQALARARAVQIAKIHGAVHYLVCDRQGACATFEVLGGKLVVHSGARLPVPVLANNTYQRSVRYLRQHAGFGGARRVPTTLSSLDRFVRAASLVRSSARARAVLTPVARAFRVLDSVYTKDWTRWQIVYQPRQGKVHFRDAGNKSAATYVLDARAQDYRCGSAVRMVDLRGTISGKRLGPPVAFTYAHNLKLLRLNFGKLDNPLPDPVLRLVAAYPRLMTSCAGAKPAAKGKP